MTAVQPGDIACTRNPHGLPAFAIRLGAALLDRPNTVNHVIVVHHRDAAGTLWGIEARPGGVGWVDMAQALRSPYTITNADQPKTPAQRAVIAAQAQALLGTPYDWAGIARDGMAAIHADALWKSKAWGRTPPAHVVCSSFADWLYDYVQLPSPGSRYDRTVTPGDWARFIIERSWA